MLSSRSDEQGIALANLMADTVAIGDAFAFQDQEHLVGPEMGVGRGLAAGFEYLEYRGEADLFVVADRIEHASEIIGVTGADAIGGQ